jgi:hypothetical protein
MTKPLMMNYTITADNEAMRDQIVRWIETNITVPWELRMSSWGPDEDNEGKWGLFVDGGTVSTKRKRLSAFPDSSFVVQESGESSL